MKRTLLSTLVMMISLFSLTVSASASTLDNISHKNHKEAVSTLERLQKQLSENIFATTKLNKENEINNIDTFPELITIKEIAESNPKAFEEFMLNLDVFNEEKVQNKLKGITLGSNETKTIPMEDGSFIVLSSSLSKTIYNKTLVSNQYTTSSSFQCAPSNGMVATNTYKAYGPWQVAELNLMTDFSYCVNENKQNGVKINDAHTSGTTLWPWGLSSHSASIVNSVGPVSGPNRPKSRGVFNITESMNPGQPIIHKTVTLETEFGSNGPIHTWTSR